MKFDHVNRLVGRNATRIVYAGIAAIGYILSPLSWWNDLAVNIPLALLIANFTHKITGINKELLFVISYWLTNIIGIIMMLFGGEGVIRRKASLRSFILSIAISLIYTIIIIKLLL